MTELKVNDRVANRFRRDWLTAELNPASFGTVTRIEEGVNALVYVRVDGRDFDTPFVPTDLVKIA